MENRGKELMEVEYIDHSGFSVETDHYFLIFDYFKGGLTIKQKPTIVFSSHHHGDHFNPEIFDWQKDHPQIHYVLGHDIEVEKQENRFFMAPCQKMTIGEIEIKSFGSTDEGVSFLVRAEGKHVFHAGDLNWWHWSCDSREDQLKAEDDFKEEISKIDKVPIDLAFFPVDPRLGDQYDWGGLYFIDQLRPKFFFPCHFVDNYEIIRQFAGRVKEGSTRVMEIEKRNQVFVIKRDA